VARRLLAIRALVLLAFVVILARLVQLQVVEGAHNRKLADENRIRVTRRLAPRGQIRDRSGEVLAASRLAFSVCVVPEEFGAGHSAEPVSALADLVDLPAAQLRTILDEPHPGRAVYEPLVVHRDASPSAVARLEEHAAYLTGVSVVTDAVRQYPHKSLASHVIGYVREIGPEELQRPEYAGYRPRDLIGKAGVEKVAERALRGVDGGDQIEVDARGRRVRTLGTVAPEPGHDVWLTIDAGIQQAAEEALGDRAGAVVALDPWTGDILALASHPTYDLNIFSGALTPEKWRALTGPGEPQHNRAITACYPPGSVFKIVTAAAALEAGVVNERSRYLCTGVLRLGGWRLRCWKRTGHGTVDFLRGFAQSCNVMFATLGRDVGADRLAEMARNLGLGERTGIELPQEAAGLVPSPDWKRRVRHQAWFPGDTCQMAIGQGEVLVTPLQIARMVAVIANGGQLVRPHVIAKIEGYDDYVPPSIERRVGLRPETIALIRAGMEGVVSPGGTASRIATPKYKIAGKTGTAEAPGGQPHAWFAGFAPADHPRIAVAVIVEHAGGGSVNAAPIARHVFDAAILPAEERTPWTPPKVTVAAAH